MPILTPLLDNFNRTMAEPPTGWSTGSGLNTTDSLRNLSNQLAKGTTGYRGCARFNTVFPADQEVWVEIGSLAADDFSLEVRIQNGATSTARSYVLLADVLTPGTYYLQRYANGAFAATLATNTTGPTMAVGGFLVLRAVGTNLTAYYITSGGTETQLFNVTDSNITGAGQIGVNIGTTGAGPTFDNFGGGGLPVTDTRDARVTGIATQSSSSQDVRITGKGAWRVASLPLLLNNNILVDPFMAVDVRVTGVDTASLRKAQITWAEMEVPLVGSGVTTSDARDVRLQGQATLADNRDVRLIGQATLTDSRDVRLRGQATLDETRDIRATGRADNADYRDVRATGWFGFEAQFSWTEIEVPAQASNVSTDTRDVSLRGQTDATVDRDVRITGYADLSTTRDVRAIAYGESSLDRDVRLTAQADAPTVYDVRVTGTADISEDYDVRVVGRAESAVERDVRVTGFLTLEYSQIVRVRGQSDSSAIYDARVFGHLVTATDRDIRVRGQLDSNIPYDIRLSGQAPTTITHDVRATGRDDNSRSYDVRLRGRADSTSVVETRVIGRADTSATRDIRARGQADATRSVDVRVTGRAASSFVTDIRLVGTVVDASITRDVRLIGTIPTALSHDVRLMGQAPTATTRDAWLTASSPNEYVADVRLTGEAFSEVAYRVRLRGFKQESSHAVRVRLVGKSKLEDIPHVDPWTDVRSYKSLNDAATPGYSDVRNVKGTGRLRSLGGGSRTQRPKGSSGLR